MTFSAQVVEVVDGDSLVVTSDEPFEVAAVRIRLVGVDAPEMPTWAGRRAKKRLTQLCPPGSTVLVTPAHERDPYDRLLAVVGIPDVGARLVEEKLARRWRQRGRG